jgi:hypothetical protein
MSKLGLVTGMATSVGSLPHVDAHEAAQLVLRCLPDLPAVPELPNRSPHEALLERAGDEIAFTDDAHGGLLAFLDAAAAQPPAIVKAQVPGPLTLGIHHNGEFDRGAQLSAAWAKATRELFAARLPQTKLVVMFDEPALVQWSQNDGSLDRESAIDMLSATFAECGTISGVHVCGAGDLRLALSAGPDLVHLDTSALDLDDASSISRYLDGGGWIAWGAIPTDRPVGEAPQPLWNALVNLWCELTRRGCDPVRLRTQALIAPACGLAGHGVTQAERTMQLAYDIGQRVHHHVVASKLAVGA